MKPFTFFLFTIFVNVYKAVCQLFSFMVKRRFALIIPVFAIIMVSLMGIAYAIQTADVQNTDNTTLPEYAIVTPQGVHAYSGGFSNGIALDTENRNGTITYTISDGQTSDITVSGVDREVILLGEMLFNIDQTNMDEDYVFTMTDVAGTMTGTFYMGISTSEDNDTFSAWSYASYVIGTGSSFDVDNEIEWVKVRLYVDSSFQTDGGPLAASPLNSVTFQITATLG